MCLYCSLMSNILCNTAGVPFQILENPAVNLINGPYGTSHAAHAAPHARADRSSDHPTRKMMEQRREQRPERPACTPKGGRWTTGSIPRGANAAKETRGPSRAPWGVARFARQAAGVAVGAGSFEAAIRRVKKLPKIASIKDGDNFAAREYMTYSAVGSMVVPALTRPGRRWFCAETDAHASGG